MRLSWDDIGKRLFETGVDRGVLYPMEADGTYGKGVAWNGLTAVNDSKEGGEPEEIYADNIQYLSLASVERYGCTIEAYTYPDEFAECDGSAEVTKGVYITQQTRKHFGFCHRSLVGNDTEGTEYGYKLHLIYGCLAAPSDQEHSTVNETPEAETFSWDVSTTPVPVEGYKPTAHLIVDSTKVDKEKLAELEDMLYGKSGASGDPKLPTPDEVIALIGAA